MPWIFRNKGLFTTNSIDYQCWNGQITLPWRNLWWALFGTMNMSFYTRLPLTLHVQAGGVCVPECLYCINPHCMYVLKYSIIMHACVVTVSCHGLVCDSLCNLVLHLTTHLGNLRMRVHWWKIALARRIYIWIVSSIWPTSTMCL